MTCRTAAKTVKNMTHILWHWPKLNRLDIKKVSGVAAKTAGTGPFKLCWVRDTACKKLEGSRGNESVKGKPLRIKMISWLSRFVKFHLNDGRQATSPDKCIKKQVKNSKIISRKDNSTWQKGEQKDVLVQHVPVKVFYLTCSTHSCIVFE